MKIQAAMLEAFDQYTPRTHNILLPDRTRDLAAPKNRPRGWIAVVVLLCFIVGLAGSGCASYRQKRRDTKNTVETTIAFMDLRLRDLLTQYTYDYPMVHPNLRVKVLTNAMRLGKAFRDHNPDYEYYKLDASGLRYSLHYMENKTAVVYVSGKIRYWNWLDEATQVTLDESLHVGLTKVENQWLVTSLTDDWNTLLKGLNSNQ